MSGKTPMRLPPVRVLRVRNPNRAEPNPCLTVMSSVLSCWASVGYNLPGCAAIENQLRVCMDAPAKPMKKTNTINYHLQRFAKRMTGKSNG